MRSPKTQNPLVTARVDPNNSITLMIEQERNRVYPRPLDNQHDSQTMTHWTESESNDTKSIYMEISKQFSHLFNRCFVK